MAWGSGVVPSPSATNDQLASLAPMISDVLGAEANLAVETVESLAVGPGGKNWSYKPMPARS